MDQIDKIADLARLNLSDDEKKKFSSQIADVIQYIEQLKEVNVSGVKPMIHPFDRETPFREDVVNEFPKNAEGKPKVLDSAPDSLYDGYKVPPILGTES